MTKLRFWLQLLFWLAFAGWFALLVRPEFRDESAALARIDPGLPYLVAKGLHASVYAALGLGAAALFRRRWWALAAVAAHAVLSEVCQYWGNVWFATGRHGCAEDVLLDWCGSAAGVGVWWLTRRVWRARPPARPSL